MCERAHAHDAWVHVDGAFGLWAAAAPSLRHLAEGIGAADSWGTDAHKWLNVPYDSGLVFVRDGGERCARRWPLAARTSRRAMQRVPYQYTPDFSRRARGIEVWAALRHLGRAGLADLIERHCRYARRFAAGLTEAGCQVLNEVVLNQVLVSFGDAARTRRVIAARAGGGHVLVRRHPLAGPRGHAHQRIVLGDHRAGRRAQSGGHRARGRGEETLKTIIEPFRMKVIEPIRMTSRAEREHADRGDRLQPVFPAFR